jgi:hypothetical protein
MYGLIARFSTAKSWPLDHRTTDSGISIRCSFGRVTLRERGFPGRMGRSPESRQAHTREVSHGALALEWASAVRHSAWHREATEWTKREGQGQTTTPVLFTTHWQEEHTTVFRKTRRLVYSESATKVVYLAPTGPLMSDRNHRPLRSLPIERQTHCVSSCEPPRSRDSSSRGASQRPFQGRQSAPEVRDQCVGRDPGQPTDQDRQVANRASSCQQVSHAIARGSCCSPPQFPHTSRCSSRALSFQYTRRGRRGLWSQPAGARAPSFSLLHPYT